MSRRLVLIATHPDARSGGQLAGALRDALAEPGSRAVAIDLAADLEIRPPADLITPHAPLQLAAAIAPTLDAHDAAGVTQFVVTLPPGLDAHWPALALQLLRRHDQRVALIDLARGSPGPADQLASRLRADDPTLHLEPLRPRIPQLLTPRLMLGEPTASQRAQFYRDIVGTTIFDTLLWDGPRDENDMHHYGLLTRQWWARGPAAPAAFNIMLRQSPTTHPTTHPMTHPTTANPPTVIGGCSWRPKDNDPARGSIGYTLSPRFHGSGYATEAVAALVDWVFEHRPAELVLAEVFVGNTASRRVVEKLGFKLMGTMPAATPKRGRRMDEWWMILTRDAWAARQAADRPASGTTSVA